LASLSDFQERKSKKVIQFFPRKNYTLALQPFPHIVSDFSQSHEQHTTALIVPDPEIIDNFAIFTPNIL
jgi:hypothetical protein